MENSEVPENSEQVPKKSEQIPEKRIPESEPKKDEPEKVEKRLTQVEVEEATAAPKSRGRPKNSRDTKPRIKRIPIAAPEDEQPKPTVKVKKVVHVVVQEEPDSEIEQEEEVATPIPEPEPTKSPRTLRREHMQSVATQKRAMTQARQDRFERVLDGFMGF